MRRWRRAARAGSPGEPGAPSPLSTLDDEVERIARDRDRTGKAVGFALFNLQGRATLFVSPGEDCYAGMFVGENVRQDDMEVNVNKEKKLTNMRTTSTDENIKLEPPRRISLELAMEFIEDDELIEITPDAIRLRKRVLDANQRKKASKKTLQPA